MPNPEPIGIGGNRSDPAEATLVRFGPFTVDLRARSLSRAGEPVALTAKVFDVLAILLRNHGRVVERETMMQVLWPDTVVEDGNLHHYVSALRRRLGEKPGEHKYIVTLPARGYSFVAPVEMVEASPATIVNPAPAPEPVAKGVKPQFAFIPAIAAILVLSAAVLLAWRGGQLHPARQKGLPVVVPFTTMPGWESYPSSSADGTRVAFSWRQPDTDNWNVFVKQIGSEALLQVTSGPQKDLQPVWSPDGRYIAFFRESGEGGSGYFIVPSIGGSPRRLTTAQVNFKVPVRTADWSPDGRHLIVSDKRTPDETLRLYIVSLDTGEKLALTSPPPTSLGDRCPAVSPDGRWLAFVRSLYYGVTELHVMPLAGGPSRALSDQSGPIHPTLDGLAWTPDSKWIIRSDDQGLVKIAIDGRPSELIPLGGGVDSPACSRRGQLLYSQVSMQSDLIRISLHGDRLIGQPSTLLSSTREQSSPDLSPEGKLAFTSARSGLRQIWRSDGDGRNLLQLTSLVHHRTQDPRWSPDGKSLVFVSRTENPSIYIVSSEGGQTRRLTTVASDDESPSWSSDGKFVYFASNRDGSWRIWKLPAEGGAAAPVTSKSGYYPQESPDGRYLYFETSFQDRTVWRMAAGGGPEEVVLDASEIGYRTWWRPAKDGIYYIDSRFALRYFDSVRHVHSGPLMQFQRWQLLDDPVMALSRDDRSMVISLIRRSESDLMLIDRF